MPSYTQNSFMMVQAPMKVEQRHQLLQMKLSKDWKGIYRYVSIKDVDNLGKVPMRVFIEALNHT